MTDGKRALMIVAFYFGLVVLVGVMGKYLDSRMDPNLGIRMVGIKETPAAETNPCIRYQRTAIKSLENALGRIEGAKFRSFTDTQKLAQTDALTSIAASLLSRSCYDSLDKK